MRAEIARAGISQAVVADALTTSQQAISRRISGAVPFRVDELYRIADLLQISVTRLLADDHAQGAA